MQLDNDGDRHDNRKFLERVNKLTLLASKSFQSLNISNQWNIPMENSHVIMVVANTTLHISCILVTRPISIMPRRSMQLVGAVVDTVADAKVTEITGSRSMIIRMGIEMIIEMVFKRGEMLGCDIAVVKSLDEILPTPLYFILLGSVILALSPFQLTMTTGIF